MHWLRLVRSVLFFVVLLVCVPAFWITNHGYTEAAAKYDGALAVSPPAILGGAPLDLSVGVTAPPVSSLGLRVVVAYSETCATCQQQLISWERFLPALSLGSRDELLLIAISDAVPGLAPLEAKLAAAGKTVETLRVSNPAIFVRASGITHTPMVILLDQLGRVRFMSDLLTEKGAEVLSRLVVDLGGK